MEQYQQKTIALRFTDTFTFCQTRPGATVSRNLRDKQNRQLEHFARKAWFPNCNYRGGWKQWNKLLMWTFSM